MKRLIWIACILFTLVSCQETYLDQPVQNSIESNSQTTTRSFTIPVDSAMKNLKAYLAQTNDNKTRSEDTLDISEVYPVVCGEPTTRAYDFTTRQDTLLYVVNFKNDDGFVIMSADTRLPETVIAQIDKGNLPEGAMTTAINSLKNPTRKIYDGYPTTGPGFLKDNNFPDEVFINPNTIDWYDPIRDEYRIGNYTPGEIKNPEYLNGWSSQSSDRYMEEFVGLLCVEFAIDEINKPNTPGLPLNFNQLPINPIDPIGPGGSPVQTHITYSDWKTISEVSPILTKFAKWGQGTPFNDYNPKVHRFILFGQSRKAYAGCFPLAISKILTHFKKPKTFTNKGQTVNWNALAQSYMSIQGKASAATLLNGIAIGCHSLFFYEGTFTFPGDAVNFMHEVGFWSCAKKNYSFERVKSAIDAGNPPIVYGVPKNWDITKSHAWNIDGYKIYERTKTVQTNHNGISTTRETTKETKEMVHCDFGWGGNCNGYYISGLFKSYDENTEIDSGSDNTINTKYVKYLHLLTY